MKFGITGNVLKPEFETIFKQVYTFLTKNNHEVWLSNNVFIDRSSQTYKTIPQKSIDEIGKDCDIILSIGGDGTILSTFRQVAEYEIPIFGIHIGGLGFLGESNQDTFKNALNSILSGNYFTEKRMALKLNINNNPKISHYSLNDIVIDNGNSPRTLQLHVYISNHFLNTYISDGVIFSTPTGSTAYSLSAGGPIITPNLNVIGVTPICPHSLSARPIILSDNENIRIQFSEENVGMAVSVDGQIHIPIDYTQEVNIARSKFDALLIRLPYNDYYSTLRTKMGWSGNFR
ncbi:MAG: NAD(+)/NADH kinase [Candidatus Marinimicrobia bacterium]|nr:NAD(+)/NADH kinase [Candidatus Neomarinimicrobiota bacterium]